MFKNYKHHCFKGQTICVKCSCHSDSIRRENNRHILNHDMSNIQDHVLLNLFAKFIEIG